MWPSLRSWNVEHLCFSLALSCISVLSVLSPLSLNSLTPFGLQVSVLGLHYCTIFLYFSVLEDYENIREEFSFVLILTFCPYIVQKCKLSKAPYLLSPQFSSL